MNLDLLEALLFVQSEPVALTQVGLWLGVDDQAARAEIEALQELLISRGSGLTVQWVAGGIRLTTHPQLHSKLTARLQYRAPEPLSHASWEVLAVVAYRQPVTRLEIEAIRQTGSESAIETLVQRELIQEVGRKEAPGRPILYGTTGRFLAQFGLESLADLPSISQDSGPSA